MFLKFVVFGAFAATLVESQVPPNPLVVGGVFDGYVLLIRNAIEAATGTLSNSRGNLRQQADVIGSQSQASLSANCSSLLGELQVLIERAKALVIDVNACVANVEQRIIDIQQKYTNQLIKCQESIVNEGTIIINEVTIEIENLSKELNALLNRYNGCSGLVSVTCQTEVIALASEASVRIPAVISKAVGRVTAFNSGLQATLANCGSSNVQLAVSEGQGIINDVAACIDSNRPVPLN